MKVTFDYLDEFLRGAKALRKKYPSFEGDYNTFLDELEKNPFSGESLGIHTYKNRMAIASKGRARVEVPVLLPTTCNSRVRMKSLSH